MIHSPTIANLAKSLLIAHRAITSAVAKNCLNQTIGNNYVDLGATIDAIKPALNDAGIVVIQSPTACDKPGYIAMTTRLLHETGEWIEDTCDCPLEFLDPQAFGSATTYMRRYALGAMMGLYSADDDGQNAVGLRRTLAHSNATPGGKADDAGGSTDDEVIPPELQKRVDSWLNTIKNASLERLETSRSSAKTTFNGKAFDIIDKAFTVRIAELKSPAKQAS